jgi:hypothetical protein
MNMRAGGYFVLAFLTLGAGQAVFGFFDEVSGAEGGAGITVSSGVGGAASDKQLNAWINDALKVMKQEGIPGSFNGIKRNVIRESGGNPTIVNDWDINAKNGTPSKGLLQVIQPTFNAYKLPQSAYDRAGVKANANSLTDPIANIVTACNYAAARYGSMDNVNGPY